MALLTILEFPDPRLRTVAKPVTEFDGVLEQLVYDMFETMVHAEGIGLAATQVNIHKRVVVMDIAKEGHEPIVLINPSIEELTEELQDYSEGCLSVPGFVEEVTRCARIRVDAQDIKGNPFSFECDGLKAICIQHELDHLNGKLFVDHISSLKRQRIRQKLEKSHRKSKES